MDLKKKLSIVFQNIYNTVHDYVGKKQEPIDNVVEPICSLFRLIILSYKPDGTKIGIQDNRIVYHTPSFFQGTQRWTNGTSREQIAYLFISIHKIISIYVNQQQEYEPLIESKHFTMVTELAITGLQKLKNSYVKTPTLASQLISLYITILQNQSLDTMTISEFKDTNEFSIKIYDFYHSVWSHQELNLLITITKQLQESEDPSIYLDTLDKILINKEISFRNLLLQSYQPINKSQSSKQLYKQKYY